LQYLASDFSAFRRGVFAPIISSSENPYSFAAASAASRAFLRLSVSRFLIAFSSESQAAFNRGLVWLYGYNHEAAAEAFKEAIAADPGCGAALWGLVYAIGPNYNRPWEFFDADERKATLDRAHMASAEARALKDNLSAVENDLIYASSGSRGPSISIRPSGSPADRTASEAARAVAASATKISQVSKR
jgi:hypothetical protein